MLDSAEIIDRVHYARAMHRYLHTSALQRTTRGALSLPRVLESLMHPPRMQFPLHVSSFRIERRLRLKCDKTVLTEINKARRLKLDVTQASLHHDVIKILIVVSEDVFVLFSDTKLDARTRVSYINPTAC